MDAPQISKELSLSEAESDLRKLWLCTRAFHLMFVFFQGEIMHPPAGKHCLTIGEKGWELTTSGANLGSKNLEGVQLLSWAVVVAPGCRLQCLAGIGALKLAGDHVT